MEASSVQFRRGAAVVAAIVVALLVWLLFIKDDDDSDGASEAEKSVRVYSAATLPQAASGTGYPIYWIGEKEGVDYELTLITDGRTYVRYLPQGVSAGATTPFPTVGSYRQTNPVQVLQELDDKPGTDTFSTPDDGLGLTQRDIPTSVYVAFPGVDAQIEVYDPKPGRAERLVKRGEVVPVG